MSLEILKKSLQEAPIVKKGGYLYVVHPITDGVPEVSSALLKEVTGEIKKHVEKGEFASALEQLDELSVTEKVDGLILKSKILEKQGKLTESLVVISQVLKESSGFTEFQNLGALISKGYVLVNLGKLEELAQVIQEGEKLLQGLDGEDVSQKEQDAIGHRGCTRVCQCTFLTIKTGSRMHTYSSPPPLCIAGMPCLSQPLNKL